MGGGSVVSLAPMTGLVAFGRGLGQTERAQEHAEQHPKQPAAGAGGGEGLGEAIETDRVHAGILRITPEGTRGAPALGDPHRVTWYVVHITQQTRHLV
jgi:hypothetical protein